MRGTRRGTLGLLFTSRPCRFLVSAGRFTATLRARKRRVCQVEFCRRSSATFTASNDLATTRQAFKLGVFFAGTTGIQLAPDIQHRLWALFERHRGAIHSLKEGRQLGLDKKEFVSCKLVIQGSEATAETVSSTQDEDWFAWKVERGAAYRGRGNEAFKHESYRSAVRLYKRALAWLKPPLIQSDTSMDKHVQYSEEEMHQVNPLAVACYTNMATCYSKLSDVDRCIAAASSALTLDDAHVKARYRRSQAYVSSKEFDLALADLIKLRELEPDKRLFQSALTKTHNAKTNLRKKQQNTYGNLLDK